MRRKRTAFFLASLLVIVGVVVTLENFLVINGISFHWPVFLLITGCGFVMLFFHGNKTDLVKLWLGTFVFILGIFFYYLNFAEWAGLSSLWPVFLGIVGLSFLSIGVISKTKIYNYFALSFIALFIIFTLVFSISYRLWPLSFVVFGISLFFLDYWQNKTLIRRKNESGKQT